MANKKKTSKQKVSQAQTNLYVTGGLMGLCAYPAFIIIGYLIPFPIFMLTVNLATLPLIGRFTFGYFTQILSAALLAWAWGSLLKQRGIKRPFTVAFTTLILTYYAVIVPIAMTTWPTMVSVIWWVGTVVLGAMLLPFLVQSFSKPRNKARPDYMFLAFAIIIPLILGALATWIISNRQVLLGY